MSTFSRLTLSAAILVGSVASASAVDLTGGSVGLTYSETDFNNVTVDATGINGVLGFALSPKVSGTAMAASTKFSAGSADFTDETVGGSLAYALAPNAKVGGYYERLSVKPKGAAYSFDANVYGVEGSYDISNQISVSAYIGTVDGSDVGSSEDTFGMRGDLALNSLISLYASYESDHWNGGTDYVSNFGGSYDLKAASGMPFVLQAGFGQIGGDSFPDTYTSYYVGAKYVFGAKDPAAKGFAGGHAGIYATAGF